MLLLLACSGGPGASIPTATATRGEFVARLVVPGELEAVKSETISAPSVRGTLKIATVVEDGARVRAGDVLVEFDRAELERELETATSRLEVSRTKIAQQRAQLDVRLASVQNEVVTAELNLKRAEMRITASETVPRIERESARIDVEEQTLALERNRAALQSARLEGEASLELLRLEAAEAQAKVTTLKAQLDQFTVRAPADGIVMLTEAWRNGKMGKITAGDTVWSGNSLMELPDLAAMRVDAWVHEIDATRVRADQPVSIVVEAHPEPPYAGHIEKVADLAVSRHEDAGAKFLKISVAIDKSDAILKPGMSVRTEIELERVADAISIPREAVYYDAGAAYAWRAAGGAGAGDHTRAPVELGVTNDTHVVVRAGLAEGDVVALIDPTTAGP